MKSKKYNVISGVLKILCATLMQRKFYYTKSINKTNTNNNKILTEVLNYGKGSISTWWMPFIIMGALFVGLMIMTMIMFALM